MIFVGIALLITVLIAAIISTDVGSFIGLNQMDTAQMVILLGIVLLIAAGFTARRIRFGEMMAGAVAWIALFAVAIGGYAFRDEITGVASRVWGELSPQSGIVSADGQTVTFRKGGNSSFTLGTLVNDAEIPMIFDTGATAVVLTFQDAQRAGFTMSDLRYDVPVQTANGMARAARVRLPYISVGGIERRNVIAFISEPGALETSLLGMSFLETLSSYSVSQNSLVLEG